MCAISKKCDFLYWFHTIEYSIQQKRHASQPESYLLNLFKIKVTVEIASTQHQNTNKTYDISRKPKGEGVDLANKVLAMAEQIMLILDIGIKMIYTHFFGKQFQKWGRHAHW